MSGLLFPQVRIVGSKGVFGVRSRGGIPGPSSQHLVTGTHNLYFKSDGLHFCCKVAKPYIILLIHMFIHSLHEKVETSPRLSLSSPLFIFIKVLAWKL